MIQMTNQSTKDRGIPDKSPKTDFTIPYLPSESIFKWKHEKTVQMETDFSSTKTRNSNSDFLGPRNYKATAMHHGKWEWVFKASADRVSVNTIGRYGDRHSAAEWRWSIGWVSADILVSSCQPTRDWVSTDISAECQSIYWPSVGRDIGR